MKKEDCVFCKIAGGELPSNVVYEDEFFKAIMDISPAAPGHVIILAKNHAADIFELETPEMENIFKTAKKIASAMKKTLKCDGVNILQNNGTAAGQSVFHFHVHIIPRYHEDPTEIRWKLGSYQEGEAAALAKCMRENM